MRGEFFYPTVLAIIGGSTTIRFSVNEEDSFIRQLSGKIDRIGLKDTTMSVLGLSATSPASIAIPDCDFEKIIEFLMDWIAKHPCSPSIRAIGH